MKTRTRILSVLMATGFMIGAIVAAPAHSADWHSTCLVPYNISAPPDWTTGVNITVDTLPETIAVMFYGPSVSYATVYLNLSANRSWTGTVQDLLKLNSGAPAFQSPSMLTFWSQKGNFTVTQFIMNSGSLMGFGHQTFYSYPYIGVGTWPYK